MRQFLFGEGLNYGHTTGNIPGSEGNACLVLKGAYEQCMHPRVCFIQGIKNQEDANDKDGQCFPAWHLLSSPASSATAPLLRLLQPNWSPRCSLNNPQTLLLLGLASKLTSCLRHLAPLPPTFPLFCFQPKPHLFQEVLLMASGHIAHPVSTNHVTRTIPCIHLFTIFMCIFPDFSQTLSSATC